MMLCEAAGLICACPLSARGRKLTEAIAVIMNAPLAEGEA
jgi:hypothetical protein